VTKYLISVQRTIGASPQRCFDIIADPAMHPVIDGSGSVRAAHGDNPARLAPGVEFGMDMKLGGRYKITNRVVEFDEPRLIAWRHFNGHVWRYRFEPDGDHRTLVTEQWDATRVWNRSLLVAFGFATRNRRGMRATLERLAEQAKTEA
jgi:uncharacterized protein YndB with AHSA1/START domain